MTDKAQKRRKSRSPKRDTASKRARILSSSASVRSQHVERANSGPYCIESASSPEEYTNVAQFPKGDGWTFRVKVISSSTNLGNDVFENAVQGLAKICFPDDVLDQLGVQVLEQHMRKENAPDESIERMLALFPSEMTRRVICLLSKQLDTPTKLLSAMEAMVRASASLHEDSVRGDILNDISSSVLQLRERYQDHTVEEPAKSVIPRDKAVVDEATNSGKNEQPTCLPKTKLNKKGSKKKNREHLEDGLRVEDAEEDIITPVAQPEHGLSKPSESSRRGKDGKISPKWRWDIEPASLSDGADISEAFPHTSDLFAYHALPIVRRKLGTQASRKELRHEMQAQLDEMPDDEFEKWMQSLQKLLDGDREMLTRPELDPSRYEQRLAHATPAPIDMQKHVKRTAKTTAGSFVFGRDSMHSHDDVSIKREAIADRSPGITHEGRVADPTVALPRSSTEEHNIQPSVENIGPSASHSQYIPTNASDGQPDFFVIQTPIIDLLWGGTSFNKENISDIRHSILNNLNKRLPMDSIAVQALDGTATIQSKAKLEHILARVTLTPKHQHAERKLRQAYEYKLVPWVLAQLSAFPELLVEPFVFVDMLSSHTIVSDIIFDPRAPLPARKGPHHQRVQWIESVLLVLKQREVLRDPEDRVLTTRMRNEIRAIVDTAYDNDVKKRTLLEKVLRRAIFPHRTKFPQLRFTPVVKAWERTTGLKW